MNKETEPTRPQPFFARFLEGQDYPDVQTNVKAGPGGGHGGGGTLPDADQNHTMKYPSDDDENPSS